MRAGFEATLPSEDVWGAANEEEVASAIAEILDRTADAPHEVLIVGPMRYGEAHYAEVLKRGGATFFLAEGVDTAKYGLGNATSFQWVFNPDVTTAAEKVAKEICRTTGHRVRSFGAPQRMLQLSCEPLGMPCSGPSERLLTEVASDSAWE